MGQPKIPEHHGIIQRCPSTKRDINVLYPLFSNY
jgi:hypothetical protein